MRMEWDVDLAAGTDRIELIQDEKVTTECA
jgi:hypothetical protein